ncbi:hypothetical protein ES703_38601 [subsurface metagenome]
MLDGAKDHLGIAGIPSQEKALELQRVLLMPRVAHLADAVDSLVRIDTNDEATIVAADDVQMLFSIFPR